MKESGLNQVHSDIKACPFCGSDVEFLRYKAKPGILFDSIGIMSEDYKNVGQIACIFCGAVGPVSDNAHQACTKWDRRVK